LKGACTVPFNTLFSVSPLTNEFFYPNHLDAKPRIGFFLRHSFISNTVRSREKAANHLFRKDL
jgi:hypothetical protein